MNPLAVNVHHRTILINLISHVIDHRHDYYILHTTTDYTIRLDDHQIKSDLPFELTEEDRRHLIETIHDHIND